MKRFNAVVLLLIAPVNEAVVRTLGLGHQPLSEQSACCLLGWEE
ncbi:MAG: hypothetical protein OXN25_06850 [Candidatus Poribacteria bacterium]|nr:hypothetical protein [Candidatus Poribacteria bacterium]